jgi:hypothetical protein
VPLFPSEGGNALNRGSQPQTRATNEHDPLADQDTLESIESEYFISEGFDPCGHELKVNLLVIFRRVDINRYLSRSFS